MLYNPVLYDACLLACSDETRFQGIATGQPGRPQLPGLGPPCSDETRFQGIATIFVAQDFGFAAFSLAVTRPVFRGLRRDYKKFHWIHSRNFLQ